MDVHRDTVSVTWQNLKALISGASSPNYSGIKACIFHSVGREISPLLEYWTSTDSTIWRALMVTPPNPEGAGRARCLLAWYPAFIRRAGLREAVERLWAHMVGA